MLEVLHAWRGELVGAAVFLATWAWFHWAWRLPFWKLWWPGALLGLAIEIITEAAWTYDFRWYVWRDVSPAVIAGWGVVFAWWIVLSGRLNRLCFGTAPASPGLRRWRTFLTDAAVGVPLVYANEYLGLHILGVWKYNECLRWETLIPGLNYPWEGFAALVCFVIAFPAAVRYWAGEVAT
jgi:hypothetical protein